MQFTFITGAEGSGTTHLATLLSEPHEAASLGGNYTSVPEQPGAKDLAKGFTEISDRLWDPGLSFAEHERALEEWREAGRRIVHSPAFSGIRHLVFKRSFPFLQPRGRGVPDLSEIFSVFPDARIAVIYRDPRASTYSNLRRGFDADLRRLAVSACEHLTLLAAQVRAIGHDRTHIVSYRQLCADPLAALEPLAAFCQLPFESIRKAGISMKLDANPDARYLQELAPHEIRWLESYFDDRRRRQWENLIRA